MSEPTTAAGRATVEAFYQYTAVEDRDLVRDYILAIEAEARAEGLDDDERTSIYDSAWLQGYEKARAEGLDVKRLHDARHAFMPGGGHDAGYCDCAAVVEKYARLAEAER